MPPPLDSRPFSNPDNDDPHLATDEAGTAPPPIAVMAEPVPVSFRYRRKLTHWWREASGNLRGSILLLAAIVSFTAMTILIKVCRSLNPVTSA